MIRDAEGNPLYVCGVARDITERKRAEEALLRANAELDGFAHAIAHDLKGPLASMGVAIDLIKVMGEGPVTDDTFANVGEALDTMARSVDRAMVLVDGLLALARAGQAPVEVTDVDVGRVLRSVLEEKSGVIEERRVEVKVDERLGTIRANELQVYQVFANLIVNAIKHNDSPEPAIEVRSLPADEPGEHRYLVRDNGPGIPLEDLKRVFLPFFERGKTGETGIGLATVEKIVRVYGGAIRAYNDGGACFEFTLPTRSP
jgi:signal transduction histidine kinase